MIRLIILFAALLAASPSFSARGVVIIQNAVAGPSSGGGGGTDDIIFYSNCDSVTSGQSPQKGSGTITIGGSYTSSPGQIGNGWDNNNSGNTSGRITFQTSGNLNPAEGSVAFWMFVAESGAGSDGEIFYLTTTTPFLRFTNVGGTYSFNYKDVTLTDFSVPTGWRHVTLRWDSDEDKLGASLEVLVDGVSVGTASGSTGLDPSSSSGKIGSADGNGHDMIIDHFTVSSSPTIDLYALRFTTP